MTSRIDRADCARIGTEDVELAKELPLASFSLLLRATKYARNANRDLWHFALKLASLRQAGLRECDLRWLILKGYLKHRPETSPLVIHPPTFDIARALHFGDETEFVLTPLGVMLAADLHGTSAAVGDEPGTQSDFAPTPLTRSGVAIPNWDFQRRELRIGRIVVKRFSVPAENQETILSAFEEESWPEHIYDPLPPAAEIDPKRRLNSAIQCLNRNQKAALLRFRGDGYGRGVRWELQLNRASA